MAIRARLLAIGDELTHGHLVDTNSPWLARQLETHGIHVECVCAIPDDPTLLTAAIREACMHAELVVATGGIGPTEDDRTRHCAAAAAGVTVDHDEASFQWIVERFRKINREMPPSNRRQALLPVGARPLRNDCGTAPGFQMLIGRAQFFALPGVPLEMQNMMMTQVLPDMRSRFGLRGALSCHLIHLVGPPEAVVGEAIAPFMAVTAIAEP